MVFEERAVGVFFAVATLDRNDITLRNELAADFDGRSEEPARVVAQVKNDRAGTVLFELDHGLFKVF